MLPSLRLACTQVPHPIGMIPDSGSGLGCQIWNHESQLVRTTIFVLEADGEFYVCCLGRGSADRLELTRNQARGAQT